MNHQPFEDWLFAEEPLTPQDAASLQAHLDSCDDCRRLSGAWQAVNVELRQAPMAEPVTGFTSRWQERLEAERQRLHRRQGLFALGYFMVGAAILTASLLVLALPLMRSPDVLLWTWVYRLVNLVTAADVLGDLFRSLAQMAGGGLSVLAWVLFVGLASEIAVLWVVSIRWLTNPGRVTEQ